MIQICTRISLEQDLTMAPNGIKLSRYPVLQLQLLLKEISKARSHRLKRLREVRLREILVPRRKVRLILWQVIDDIVIQAECILENLLRRETQPLRDRNICLG